MNQSHLNGLVWLILRAYDVTVLNKLVQSVIKWLIVTLYRLDSEFSNFLKNSGFDLRYLSRLASLETEWKALKNKSKNPITSNESENKRLR